MSPPEAPSGLPQIFTDIPGGVKVTIFGQGENGGPIQREIKVTEAFGVIQPMGQLRTIKPVLENELGGPLKKFVTNKKHRKALYAALAALKGKHPESVEETAFYIRELYRSVIS